MSERPATGVDERLERGLRDLLSEREREAATAPLGLRRRVEAIPEVPVASGTARLVRAVTPVLAVAAVVLVAIVLGSALRLRVPSVGPAASPATTSTFDPTLAGPGIVSAPQTGGYWAFVLLVCGVLVLFAIALRGRKRLVPAAVAALLFGWALLGSYYPVGASVWFTGSRTGLVQTEMPPGVSLTQYYIVAASGQPFVLGLGIGADDGPIPVRLDGLVGMPDGFIGPRFTAVWLDQDATGRGFATGPGQPFSAIDIGGRAQAIWIVGRAGACAVGPSFRQANAGESRVGTSPSLRFVASVLGWPREIDLAEPVLVEPEVPCAGPTASPFASASPGP